VFAGTGTLRAERYGPTMRDPEGRRRRERAGRRPAPLACVVTRSGDVPADIPLFTTPGSQIVLFSPVPVDLGDCKAEVELVRLDPGELTLTTVLRRLRSDFGVASLLCEGGPTLFGALLQERLIDELFLTIGPKLVGGGSSPTISSGPELKELQPLEIVWSLEHENALYMRYRLL
jgi:riboflavin biosynthesis pyrimidine reductase